jgi:hypothetical protein
VPGGSPGCADLVPLRCGAAGVARPHCRQGHVPEGGFEAWAVLGGHPAGEAWCGHTADLAGSVTRSLASWPWRLASVSRASTRADRRYDLSCHEATVNDHKRGQDDTEKYGQISFDSIMSDL